MGPRRKHAVAVRWAIALLLSWPLGAAAGTGPETTLVVVNEDSPTSLHVANEYVRLRQIPPSHVLRLSGLPNRLVVSSEHFRERILEKILSFLQAEGLEETIDVIAYSTDFPYGADFAAESSGQSLHPQSPPVASLTGLTYLGRRFLAGESFAGLRDNGYFRTPTSGAVQSHAFRSTWAWRAGREPTKESQEALASSDRYWLATVLGISGIQGNTTEEILALLRRAASADGTQPDGVVYLMKNGDVRSRAREEFFEPTLRALKERGREGVVLAGGTGGQDGKIPLGKDDVLGLVAGIASFRWDKSGSAFVPGAIAEHLTSFGGRLDGSGQTKLTAFLRAGAVGSAGTVAEPLSLWPKFPSPFLHVFYADGCSLAEAFYQSVYGPYQLLIVGDPLCRPFAQFSRVSIEGPPIPWRGEVSLRAVVIPARGRPIGMVEWFVDGRRVGASTPGSAFTLSTAPLEDGVHRVRAVAVEEARVGTRSFGTLEALVSNRDREVTLSAPRRATPLGKEVRLRGRAVDAREVEILHGRNVLARTRVVGGFWQADLRAQQLGRGVVPLQARALYPDGPPALSAWVDVQVDPPKARSPSRQHGARPGREAQGLSVRVRTRAGKTIAFVAKSFGWRTRERFLEALSEAGAGAAAIESVSIDGEVLAPIDGTYDLALHAQGRVTMEISGKRALDAQRLESSRMTYAVVTLRKGWHGIRITYAPEGQAQLVLVLGGAVVAAPLSGAMIRH